ncbi:MAG: YqeG family HAD IIIA-type phosphatase [Clostridia bacterium]|nr:YqeG family HAD IIIA-type phosphatase [Clostridia bacterium]
MKLYPNHYCENITTLTPEFLKENNIKALILDVDNTLLDFNLKIVDGLKQWHDKIRENGVKCIILSNSNKLTKVKMVADLLDIPFIKFAMKPLKRGFKMAQKQLDIPFENIAAVGDQIFTDVIGANGVKMFSILVKPLDKKDLWMTRFKRPIEELVIKSYLKKQVDK